MQKYKKICFIIGTRPEIIKMAPIMKECQKKRLNFFILHTNQHYSENLDKIFFKDLSLPKAKYNLKAGLIKNSNKLFKMIEKTEKILKIERPDIVLVEGDTDTVLAGALAALNSNVKIGHIEAGLRSFDKDMPEEFNRILADHFADFLFAPTKISEKNLKKEGISSDKIFLTGNTIVESVFQNLSLLDKESKILEKLNLKKEKYFLATVHRQENVDRRERIFKIIKGMELCSNKFNYPVIFPIHPRTKKMIDKFKIKISNKIKIIEPVGYFDFLFLEKNAKLIFTDSGGIQEEACILKVPCVTMRDNTERPETLKVKSNILSGTDPERILKCVKIMLARRKKWKNPFGDRTASKKILKIILNEHKHG